MNDTTARLDAIQERHSAWYSGDDKTAEWYDPIDFVMSYEHDRDSTPQKRAMAHEITREDIPYLLDLARKQQEIIRRYAEEDADAFMKRMVEYRKVREDRANPYLPPTQPGKIGTGAKEESDDGSEAVRPR